MSLFNRKRYLFEADDDNQAADQTAGADDGAAADAAPNDTGDDGDDANADDNADNAADQNANDEADAQDEDFDIDSAMDDAGGNDTDNNDDGGNDNASDGGDEDAPVKVEKDSLKVMDKELFDSLSPAEQQVKIKELKTNFCDMYNACDSIIDKLNSIGVELEEASPKLKRAANCLFELKKMISTYLLNIFDSTSYIENDIMYNKYLVEFDAIKEIVIALNKSYKNDNIEV